MNDELRARADENLRLMREDPDSDWVDRLLTKMANPRAKCTTLTEREALALQCLASGVTIGGAAELMGIEYYSCKNLAEGARMRLRAKNTTHAVALAIRQGLI